MHSQFQPKRESLTETAQRVAAHVGHTVYVCVRPKGRRGAPDEYVICDELFAGEQPLATVDPDGTITRQQWPLAPAGSTC